MTFIGNNILELSIQKLAKGYFRHLITRACFLLCLVLVLFRVPKQDYLLWITGSISMFSLIIVIPYLKAVHRLNRVISTIEVNASSVTFKTTEIPVIGNWLKFKKKEIGGTLTQLNIVLDTDNYFISSFHSDIYSFSFKSKKYYIVKDFFDDFKSIKANLHLDQ